MFVDTPSKHVFSLFKTWNSFSSVVEQWNCFLFNDDAPSNTSGMSWWVRESLMRWGGVDHPTSWPQRLSMNAIKFSQQCSKIEYSIFGQYRQLLKKRTGNSLLNTTDFQKNKKQRMNMCPNTFVYIVYLLLQYFFSWPKPVLITLYILCIEKNSTYINIHTH